jgi:hypothetical protein
MQGGPRLVLLGGNYTPVNAEASALIARMTVAPNARRKRAIDTLIGALKTAGVWTKLDTFYVLAAHDAASARLNWVSTSFNLTAVNSPTFVANQGYTGDGATSYLDTGFNPSTAGGHYAQNDSHMGVYVGTNISAATGSVNDCGHSSAMIHSRAGANIGAKANNTTSDAPAISNNTSIGWTAWSRVASTDYSAVRDNGTPTAVTRTSAALVSLPFYMCCIAAAGPVGSLFSSRQIRAFHCGGGLTAAELNATYMALAVYMTSAGNS